MGWTGVREGFSRDRLRIISMARKIRCLIVTPGFPVPKPPAPPPPPAVDPACAAPCRDRRAAVGKTSIHRSGKFRGYARRNSRSRSAPNRSSPPASAATRSSLELGKLPPGFSGCPYHSHAHTVGVLPFPRGHRHGPHRGWRPAPRSAPGAATSVLHPPGELHQFTNTGTTDLLYFLIADNPSVDIWQYPDSGKWGFNAPRKFFRPVDADYWDGEE